MPLHVSENSMDAHLTVQLSSSLSAWLHVAPMPKPQIRNVAYIPGAKVRGFTPRFDNGVVITDALYMLGIAKKWSLPQAVVLALEAGNDMILGVRDSNDLGSSIAAIKQSIADGGLSMARVNQSVERIIALKIQYHVWPGTPAL